MTNRVHPPKPSASLVAELSRAALSVARDSNDPLAPVEALAPIPTDPGDMPRDIDEDEAIYALLLAGFTHAEIAHDRTVKTGKRWTKDDVEAACDRVGKANVARTSRQLVYAAQLELDRHEAALKAIWSDVTSGNVQATDRFIKLSQAKREMLGLDAPDVRVQLTMGGSDALDFSALTSEELRTLQELQRKAASAAKAKVVSGRVS